MLYFPLVSANIQFPVQILKDIAFRSGTFFLQGNLMDCVAL